MDLHRWQFKLWIWKAKLHISYLIQVLTAHTPSSRGPFLSLGVSSLKRAPQEANINLGGFHLHSCRGLNAPVQVLVFEWAALRD